MSMNVSPAHRGRTASALKNSSTIVDGINSAPPTVGMAPLALDGYRFAWAIPTGTYTDEKAQDAVGSILTDTATIDLTYDDAGNQITAAVKANSVTAAMMTLAATSRLVGRTTGGAGAGEEIILDLDGTLAANSDLRVASQKSLKTYIDAIVTGLLDLKGDQDCSANPNYPAASKGDAYYVTAAGKIGGASGTSVDISDVIVAKLDNAGGTQAAVGTSWFVLEHNLVGALLAANNLSDVANAATARGNLGLGTVATLASDTDGTLVANSDLRVATQKALKTYADAVAAAAAADATSKANTAQANAIAASNQRASNLSDVANAATAASNLGLGTSNSPTWAGGTFTGSLSVGGNLIVTGSTISSGTIELEGNYATQNDGYSADAAVTSGFVRIIDPTTTQTTGALAGFVLGVNGISDPTLAVTSSAGFAATDIISISGGTANDGLYEVYTAAGNVLTVRGTGLHANVEAWTRSNFSVAVSGVGTTITKVNVAVDRTGTDGKLERAYGNQSGLTYSDYYYVGGATIPANGGGTGKTSYTVGDILQADTSSTLAALAAVATGNVFLSGGIGVVGSWGKVGLTTHVSGTLPATNGGSGFASYAVGDVLAADTTTSLSKIADVAVGSVFTSGGVGVLPSWTATVKDASSRTLNSVLDASDLRIPDSGYGARHGSVWAWASAGASTSIGCVTTARGTPSDGSDATALYTTFTTSASQDQFAGWWVLGNSNGVGQSRHGLRARVVIFTPATITNYRFWFCFSTTESTSTDSCGTHHAGLRFSTVAGDTNFMLSAKDGTTQSTTSSGAAFAASTRYVLDIVLTSTLLSVSINGAAAVTQSTNMPGNTQSLGVLAECSDTTASARAIGLERLAWSVTS